MYALIGSDIKHFQRWGVLAYLCEEERNSFMSKSHQFGIKKELESLTKAVKKRHEGIARMLFLRGKIKRMPTGKELLLPVYSRELKR